MLEKLLEIETVSIVFLGDFNPIILQPFWLQGKGLIRESEAENAKVEVIHNEIARFALDDWAKIEITKERCEFKSSKEPYFEPLKDLASSIFKILRETPIRALGINHIYDLRMPDEDSFIRLGYFLTPLNVWEGNLDNPRLLNLEIFEAQRKDGEKGNRRVRINSSDQKIQYGVVVNVNDHFDLNIDGKKSNAVTLLEDKWKESFVQSKILTESLFKQFGLLS